MSGMIFAYRCDETILSFQHFYLLCVICTRTYSETVTDFEVISKLL